MTIGLVLGDGHSWRNQAQALGQVVFDGDTSGLVGLSRVPVDVLCLDLATLPQGELAAIRTYRIARPGTRLVVSAGDARPGDPIPAALVAMGVYDLTNGSLADALAKEATFADAARWQTQTVTVPAPAERRSPATRRPVLILVAGAGYGVGTTSLARIVAQTLATQGHRVLLIDAAIMPGAARLGGPIPTVRAAPTGGHLATSEIEAELHQAGKSFGQAGGYIIVDAGRAGETGGLAELARAADTVLLAVPPAVHRLAWLQSLAEERIPANVLPLPITSVVVGGTDTDAAAVAAALKEILRDMAGQIHHLPLQRTEAAVAAILGERLLPAGQGLGMAARLRWAFLSLPAVAGSIGHLLGTVVRQASFVIGRMAGALIVAGALALIVAIVLPVFGPVHAVAQASAWAQIEWERLTTLLP